MRPKQSQEPIYQGIFEDVWAIDLNSGGVSLARLMPASQDNGYALYALRDYFHRDYDSDCAHPGCEVVSQAVQIAALKELLQAAKIEEKKVVCSVPGHLVFTRYLVLPIMPEVQLLAATVEAFNDQVPFHLDKIHIDHCILGRTESGGYHVLASAIKKNALKKYLEIFEEAGCCVYWAIAESIAAYNWLEYNRQLDDPAKVPTALINIGPKSAEIVCRVDGQFRFTRPLKTDDSDFIQAIMEAEHVDRLEAERLKVAGVIPDDLNSPIYRVLDQLVTDIRRSLAYFGNLNKGLLIKRMVLTGSGSELVGLDDYLGEAFDVETHLANNLDGLSTPTDNTNELCPSQMATILGLALGCQQDVAVGISFIPDK